MFKKIIFLQVLLLVSCSSQKPMIITKKSAAKSSVTKLDNRKITQKTTKIVEKKEIQNPIKKQDTVKPKIIAVAKDTPFVSPAKDTTMKIKDYDGVIKSIKEKGIEEEEDKPRIKPLNLGSVQVLAATTTVKVTKQTVLDYIERYKDFAQNEMLKYRIPASITLAQGILESGAGTGPLSVQANNHFGIKCHEGWTGESVRYDDDVPDECFRKYEDPKKSFEDHSAFLFTRPWYNPLFKLKQDDYKGWAKGLKVAGYATDVKYPEKLIGIIQNYKLYQYDAEVLGKETIETDIEKVEKTEKVEIEATDNKAVTTYTNATETYIVQPKEGLYSISKKFNLTVDQLKKLNGLESNNISIGQVLKIK